MGRRLAFSEKKLRGVKRRLRALQTWSDSFEGYFPTDIPPAERYWNWKIPVQCTLVQGRQTTPEIQARCAQALIDACQHLMLSKPEFAKDWRMTAVICLPDFFTSEICIYKDEGYFSSHTRESSSKCGSSRHIAERSLASEWGLVLPEGMGELGVLLEGIEDYNRPDDWYACERWYFGEVMPR